MDEKVGIRELRQNLSVYVERVKAGESLEVTERGRPVAMLVPLPASTSAIDRLVAEGRAWPAEGSLGDLPPPMGEPSEEMSRRIREALDAEREDTV
jgi:prevent-host-death family protein